MKPVIVTHKAWRVAVSDIVPNAKIVSPEWIGCTSVGDEGSGDPIASVMVEVKFSGGGITPRALIGGRLYASSTQALVSVASSGMYQPGATPTCPSLLWSPLISGLPVEYAGPVYDELSAARRPEQTDLGHVVVDAGAYDEVESSPFAFWKAAQILRVMLSGLQTSRPVTSSSVVEAAKLIPRSDPTY